MSISRIGAQANHTPGYYVRVRIDGTCHTRFFQDARHGGAELALRAAREHEAALIGSRGQPSEKRPGRRNTSGITGVSRGTDARHGRPFWMATWVEGGSQRHAHFSVKKYGEEEARRRAIEARRAGLAAKGVLPRPDTARE